MNLNGFNWLLSNAGQTLLAELTLDQTITEATFLAHATKLRKHYPADGVTAALETVILRHAASTKFCHADKLYFTREALEQATPEIVSRYRAAQFGQIKHVADACCSIGSDALMLAQLSHVTAVDLDSLRLAIAHANADALNLTERITFMQADVTTLDFADCDGIFFDPARRSNGKRIWHVEQYMPPLSTIQRWNHAPLRAAKVAPGIADDQIPPDANVEFISLVGELREACMWWGRSFGDLDRGVRVATLLHADHQIQQIIADPAGEPSAVMPPRRYLYEPDPAVIRAHAIADLAAMLNASQIDPDIAFLSSDDLIATPFADVWEIIDVMPFNLKHLRQYLRERDVGTLTVKKRGPPIMPEQLIQQLKLKGTHSQTIVLTQVQKQPVVLVVDGKR